MATVDPNGSKCAPVAFHHLRRLTLCVTVGISVSTIAWPQEPLIWLVWQVKPNHRRKAVLLQVQRLANTFSPIRPRLFQSAPILQRKP